MQKFGREAGFLENVKDHKLTILHDVGIYRHLLMKRPGSSTYFYEVITWPGCLAINGDMGSAIFTRITDMFEFFRTDELSINARYWSEKEVATSKFGENIEFDYEALPKLLNEWLEYWIGHDTPTKDEISIVEDAISDVDYVENEQQVADFMYSIDEHHDLYPIYNQDWWEHSFNKSTGYQEWRLFAINHAIREYDKEKTK